MCNISLKAWPWFRVCGGNILKFVLRDIVRGSAAMKQKLNLNFTQYVWMCI